jgi:hypothetical protein
MVNIIDHSHVEKLEDRGRREEGIPTRRKPRIHRLAVFFPEHTHPAGILPVLGMALVHLVQSVQTKSVSSGVDVGRERPPERVLACDAPRRAVRLFGVEVDGVDDVPAGYYSVRT